MQLHTAIRLQVSKSNLFYSETRETSEWNRKWYANYANTVGTENEVRYVIGVMQQYNRSNTWQTYETTRYIGVNTSEYTTSRTEELQKKMIDYPPEVLLPLGVLQGLTIQNDFGV